MNEEEYKEHHPLERPIQSFDPTSSLPSNNIYGLDIDILVISSRPQTLHEALCLNFKKSYYLVSDTPYVSQWTKVLTTSVPDKCSYFLNLNFSFLKKAESYNKINLCLSQHQNKIYLNIFRSPDGCKLEQFKKTVEQANKELSGSNNQYYKNLLFKSTPSILHIDQNPPKGFNTSLVHKLADFSPTNLKSLFKLVLTTYNVAIGPSIDYWGGFRINPDLVDDLINSDFVFH